MLNHHKPMVHYWYTLYSAHALQHPSVRKVLKVQCCIIPACHTVSMLRSWMWPRSGQEAFYSVWRKTVCISLYCMVFYIHHFCPRKMTCATFVLHFTHYKTARVTCSLYFFCQCLHFVTMQKYKKYFPWFRQSSVHTQPPSETKFHFSSRGDTMCVRLDFLWGMYLHSKDFPCLLGPCNNVSWRWILNEPNLISIKDRTFLAKLCCSLLLKVSHFEWEVNLCCGTAYFMCHI